MTRSIKYETNYIMTNARKTSNANAITFPVALKTIHDHIVRDVPNSTLDTKKMRVKLRAKMRDTHEHNATWVFNTQREYDDVRSLFDPAYATRIAKPARVRAPRKSKTPDVVVETSNEPVA